MVSAQGLRYEYPMLRARSLGLAVALSAALALRAAPSAAEGAHEAAPATETDLGGYLEGASVLEGRLLAPCCWNQTLDIHGSELSTSLRREIRTRLRAGETVEAIEADMVVRYGERIRAVPTGNPIAGFATALALGFGAAGVGAAWMLARWRRRRRDELAQRGRVASGERDRYDDEIDRELDHL